MKGLLLKDWYLTWKYARFLLLFAAAYGFAGVFFEDAAGFSILPVMLVAMLPNTLFSYDEREKWTEYAQSLPVSRAQYVTGKYLYGALCYAAYLAVIAALNLAAGTEDYGTLFAMQFSIGLLTPSVLLPFMFRFGTEKGRMAYLLVISAVFGMSMVLTNGARGVSTLAKAPIPLWALCLVIAVIYILSWRLSILLYEKRKL